ncbi:hypothetical protein Tco_0322895 [Tanacetum coccineum]
MARINFMSHAYHDIAKDSIISSEQIRNSSSPKRVHFINRITIISKEDDTKEQGSPRDVERDNLGDRACKNTKEVEEVGECMEYEETIDLVDTCDESVYESLIEEMPSCSLNLDFRIQKGDPSNLKFLEQGLIIFMDRIKEVTIKTSYNDPEMDELTSEGHYLLSSRVVLSEDDYRRGCERASDLESRFYMDVDKLDPSYKEETDRINLDGSL